MKALSDSLGEKMSVEKNENKLVKISIKYKSVDKIQGYFHTAKPLAHPRLLKLVFEKKVYGIYGNFFREKPFRKNLVSYSN